MSGRARNRLAFVLACLGAVVTIAAAVTVYIDHFVVDGNGFADKVAASVRKPAVSREIAVRLTAALESAVPNAIVAQRPLEDAAGSLISGGALDPVVRRAALVVHDSLLTKNAKNVSLDLADGLQLVNSFVAAQRPALKSDLAGSVAAPVVRVRNDGLIRRVADSAHLIGVLAWLLPLLALLLFAGAVAAARDRGRAVGRVGLALAAAGVGVFIVETVAVKVRLQGFAASDAVDQALQVFLGGLVVVATVLVLAGGLLAAVGSGRLSTGAAEAAFTRIWGFLRRPPCSAGPRVARALLLVALGLGLMQWSLPTIEVLALIAGFFVVVEGLTDLIALLGGTVPEGAPRAHRTRRRILVAAATILGLLALTTVVKVGVLKTPASEAELGLACNGSESLCDRPLDQVAFATSHNAMSSAEAGFIDPNQRRTITGQLDGGIRGLLIDSLMARPTKRRASALTVLDGEVRRQAEAEVGPGGISALQDFLARRVASPTGPPQPFLCHMACEIGALPMQGTLHEIRQWLDRNRNEVLLIVIQDLVTPQETARVFRASGLHDRVYTWRPGTPAPTLRQMIAQNRRVLVMAEDRGIPGSWYQPGYRSLLKETPYDNKTIASLRSDASCRPNRGRESNPLFLVNHWAAVYPPLPSKAKTVNARDFLLRRVERCARIRKAFPNLIAVDFSEIGDVVGVADHINRAGVS